MDKILSTKWHVTTSYTNNKIDRYIITAIDLAKYINKQRRVARRLKRKTGDKSPSKPLSPMNSWLIDLILKKCEEYMDYFKMKKAKMMCVNIKVIEE